MSRLPAGRIKLKRVYERAAPSDGLRVLVDRIWPRGIAKNDAALDDWIKDLAPSAKLRIWFGHRPERWDAFKIRYARELQMQRANIKKLRQMAHKTQVTLVYAARDERHNNAIVLRCVLLGRSLT